MKYDILSIKEQATSLKLEGNIITSLKNREIQRYGARRFENGRFFQTSRLGEANAERLLADTREWGGPGLSHEYGFAPPHEETRTGFEVGSEHLEKFEHCAMELIRLHPGFVFNGGCMVEKTAVSLESDYGLKLSSSGGVCQWYIIYQRKGSGNMFDGMISESAAHPRIREMIEGHSEYLAAQGHEAKVTGARMPVLFVDPLDPVKKLRESLLINRYREGSCLYASRLGEQLFSPQLTLIDRAFAPEIGQIQFFDGEGTVRSHDDLVLVEDGRFKSTISDLRFAKKFADVSTANGIRSYDSGVNLSPRSLVFNKGKKSWRETVNGLDRCLVAFVAAGGDSNDLGEFSTPVQVGYIFERGKLVGRAPQLTVKASLDNYLGKDLIAVSSDGFHHNDPSAVLIAEMDVELN